MDLRGRERVADDDKVSDHRAKGEPVTEPKRADKEAANRREPGGVYPPQDERAVLPDLFRAAVFHKCIMIPASFPLRAVRFADHHAVQRRIAAAGRVPVNHAVTPGQMDVEGTDRGTVGSAAAVENAGRLRLRCIAENPQTDRNRIAGGRTVEHAGGGVWHLHIAGPRETQRPVTGLTGSAARVGGVGPAAADRGVMVPAAGVASRAGSVRIVEIPPTNQ